MEDSRKGQGPGVKKKFQKMLILVFEVILQQPKYTFQIGFGNFFRVLAHCESYWAYNRYPDGTYKTFAEVINLEKKNFIHRPIFLLIRSFRIKYLIPCMPVYNLELFWKNFGEIHVEAVLEDAAACLQGGLCQHSQPEVLILRLETKVY